MNPQATQKIPKKITALIPCYNEARNIASVIARFPREKLERYGYDLEVVVIDNASNDGTAEIARSLGVTVISEPKRGKGNAMRAGFFHVGSDSDYIVMLDGDNTYRPEEIIRLIEPLDSGFCSVVIGSRLGGRISDGSMTAFNRAGNWIFSHLVRYFYHINVTDTLTGYFAWKREALERLRPHLVSSGFAVEMEMVTKMGRLGEDIYCVPISYAARGGHSNLRPVYDGARIFRMFVRNLLWWPRNIEPQRIAFVSDAVMPWHKGGKERRLYEISRRLVREGREIHIYTMQWWQGPTSTVHDGVHFHAISPLYPLYVNDRRSMRQAILFGLATWKLIFARFDVLDVDHMPFFPLFGARIVTWLSGKKLYATWHEVWGREYWMEYLKGPMGLYGYYVERLSLRLPDVIISNSAHTSAKLANAGCTKEVLTIPLGVDLEKIYTSAAGTRASDAIFVGRLLEHKNVALLIDAVALVKQTMPKVKCLIVGDGPEKIAIEKRILDLGLYDNVDIIESVEDDCELYALMKASKMLVLPSSREGFGLVVVEAHAAGIPVITTAHKDNAATDLVTAGVDGLIVEANAGAIAGAIREILAAPLPMTVRTDTAHYDWSRVVDQLQALHSRV